MDWRAPCGGRAVRGWWLRTYVRARGAAVAGARAGARVRVRARVRGMAIAALCCLVQGGCGRLRRSNLVLYLLNLVEQLQRCAQSREPLQ